jgi:sulfoxide reductase heme-binding subunit YedZ
MRRAVAWGSIVGVLVLLVLDAVLTRAGVIAEVLPRASGAGPWLVSRAAGLTAYVALSLEIMLGLLVSTGAVDRALPRARVVELHQWLSSVAIVLVGAHAIALLGDGFVGYDALDLTVPFAAAPRRLATGLGVLSGYAMLGLHLSFAARGKIGARTWRKLHYGAFVLYVTATVHGISAGTDTGRPFTTLLYTLSGLVVATLLGVRIVGAVNERTRRAARARSLAR